MSFEIAGVRETTDDDDDSEDYELPGTGAGRLQYCVQRGATTQVVCPTFFRRVHDFSIGKLNTVRKAARAEASRSEGVSA